MEASGARLAQRGSLEVLTWPVFDGLALDAVVTTREGGVSEGPYRSLNLGLHVGDDDAAVVENRRRAAGAVGSSLDDLVFCNQTHGRRVATVGLADRGRGVRSLGDAIADTDALVTADPGVGLVMMAADCTPIVLYDPVAQVLGCVHSGWRGATVRVGEAAIEAMAALGAQPARLVAAMGPTVAPAGYQVGPEVAEAVWAAFGDDGDRGAADDDGRGDVVLRPDDDDGRGDVVLRPDDEGRWRLNLWAANARVLTDAGVLHERIARSALSTADPAFFSDRGVRPCGRIAVIAMLRA